MSSGATGKAPSGVGPNAGIIRLLSVDRVMQFCLLRTWTLATRDLRVSGCTMYVILVFNIVVIMVFILHVVVG